MADKPKYNRRLYYPTGLISLVLLPIICIWYLHAHKAFNKIRAINISYWSPNTPIEIPDIFSKENHKDIKYSDINLNGNVKEDKIKLDYFQLEIRELVKSQDTTKCIHIHFNDQTKYWELVRAFDICYIEKAKIYIPYQNDIWVLNPRPQKNTKGLHKQNESDISLLMHCDPHMKSDKEIEEEKHDKFMFITDTVKTYLLPSLLFILMTFLTIRRIINTKYGPDRNKIY